MLVVKNPPTNEETRVWSLDWKNPLEKGMTTYSRILDWIVPWTEDPGGLKSIGFREINTTE